MERLVLVHGSVAGAASTWATQRPLAERFELVAVERPGFPPGPPVERVDFEEDAVLVRELLRDGDHLVGHSYGGVVALLAAAGRAGRASVADGDRAARDPRRARRSRRRSVRGERAPVLGDGPTDDPEAFLRGFLDAVGSAWHPPSPLPPDLEQGARTLVVERGPWEAEIPLDVLREAPFPKLVVSGAHNLAFEAICDALERELRAERVVLPGVGHTVPRHPDFNRVLTDFVERAAAGSARAADSGHA